MTRLDVAAVPRVCPCGEWTYGPCGNPCRRPELEPMPDTTGQVPVEIKGCGHYVDDECECLLIGTATYARLR